jgi:hypothetical protein
MVGPLADPGFWSERAKARGSGLPPSGMPGCRRHNFGRYLVTKVRALHGRNDHASLRHGSGRGANGASHSWAGCGGARGHRHYGTPGKVTQVREAGAKPVIGGAGIWSFIDIAEAAAEVFGAVDCAPLASTTSRTATRCRSRSGRRTWPKPGARSRRCGCHPGSGGSPCI